MLENTIRNIPTMYRKITERDIDALANGHIEDYSLSKAMRSIEGKPWTLEDRERALEELNSYVCKNIKNPKKKEKFIQKIDYALHKISEKKERKAWRKTDTKLTFSEWLNEKQNTENAALEEKIEAYNPSILTEEDNEVYRTPHIKTPKNNVLDFEIPEETDRPRNKQKRTKKVVALFLAGAITLTGLATTIFGNPDKNHPCVNNNCRRECVIRPPYVSVKGADDKIKKKKRLKIDKNTCTSCPGISYAVILSPGESVEWNVTSTTADTITYKGQEIALDGEIDYNELNADRTDIRTYIIGLKNGKQCASMPLDLTIFKQRGQNTIQQNNNYNTQTTQPEQKGQRQSQESPDIEERVQRRTYNKRTSDNIIYGLFGSGSQTVTINDKNGKGEGSTDLDIVTLGYEHRGERNLTRLSYMVAESSDPYTCFDTSIRSFNINTMHKFKGPFYIGAGFQNSTIKNGPGDVTLYEQDNNMIEIEGGLAVGRYNSSFASIGPFISYQNIDEKTGYSDYWPYHMSESQSSTEATAGIAFHAAFKPTPQIRLSGDAYAHTYEKAISSDLTGGHATTVHAGVEWDPGKPGGLTFRADLTHSDSTAEFTNEMNEKIKSDTTNDSFSIGIEYKF